MAVPRIWLFACLNFACGGNPHTVLPASVEPPPLRSGLSPHQLARSILRESSADLGFARLWQQLHDGKPINIMAFGSSITAIHGGCTHSLLPHCARCCSARGVGRIRSGKAEAGQGFLRRAFDWINSTWPHAQHTLYNGGRTGMGGLANFVGCLSTWMPTRIDLFFLEVGVGGNVPEAAEALLRRIYDLRPRAQLPAILVADFWAVHVYGSSGLGPFHAPTTGFIQQPMPLSLARYYGFPVIGEHDLSYDEYRSRRLTPKQLKPDGVHPSEDMGVDYLSDMVSFALYRSYEAWRITGPFGKAAVRTAILSVPLPPLLFNATKQYGGRSLACYSFDRGRRTKNIASNFTDNFLIDDAEGGLPPAIISNLGWRFIAFETAGASRNKPGIVTDTPGALLAIRVLPITTTMFSDSIKGESTRVAQRHGNVGNDGTAAMHLLSLKSYPHPVAIALRYLTSYKHMGGAEITCASGCSCTPLFIDATSIAKESLEKTITFIALLHASAPRVTVEDGKRPMAGGDANGEGTAPSCVVQLMSTLGRGGPRGGAGGGDGRARFKLTRIVVSESDGYE